MLKNTQETNNITSFEREQYYEKILPIFKKELLKELWKDAEKLLEEDIKLSLEELVAVIEDSDLSQEERIIVEQAKKDLHIPDDLPLDREKLKEQYQDDEEKLGAIDALQAALDIVWFEPTFGSLADGANALIYSLRWAKSLLTGKGKQAKEHMLDAGISAISLIPFADVIKILRLRKVPKLAKAGISWARKTKHYGKKKKIQRVEEKTWYKHDLAA